MAKGRNKNKEKDSYPSNRKKKADDEEEYESDASASTHLSIDGDMRSVQGDYLEDDDTMLETLTEHIDHASHKNNSIRLAAIRHLIANFSKFYLPDFLLKWKVTLLDIVLKGIKKTDEECALACALLAHISIQIGENISDLAEESLVLLRAIVIDETKSDSLRSKICLSLALTSSLSCTDDSSFKESIKSLRCCWSAVKINSQCTTLFTIALPCWALLLQDADHVAMNSAVADYSKITSYLDASQIENRIAAGETITLIYELMRDYSNSNFRFPNHAQMIETLNRHASESSKIKSKKDRRIQRYSFRQIYAYIINEEIPDIIIKFNKESLVLDTCQKKIFYDLCCELLHGGVMHQLESNLLLREVFELGPLPEKIEKVDKFSRIAFHDANTKSRNQARGKQRDKRYAVF